jgi:hypothetical protein
VKAVLSADDFSSQDNLDDPEAGWDATLTGEEEEEFFELQIVKQHDGEVSQHTPGEQTRSLDVSNEWPPQCKGKLYQYLE